MKSNFIDFIRKISDEENVEAKRELMAMELSRIRNRLKMKEKKRTLRIVAKLVYLNFSGYDVSFSYIELVNLMASTSFAVKLTGYMAAGILFDSRNDIFLLANQTILKDLASDNVYVKCLALIAIANFKNSELIANSLKEIENILNNETIYRLLKCAGAAAFACIQDNIDYQETLKKFIPILISNASHAVRITGYMIGIKILSSHNAKQKRYYSLIKPCIDCIRNLRSIPPTRAHGFNCINDPFLQIAAIRVLGLLKKNSDDIDCLFQEIVTNLDIYVNAGRSILYETIEAVIMSSKNRALRNLAINQICKMLNTKQPNICYSVLSLLTRILHSDKNIIDRRSEENILIQKYKYQILSCMEQNDISIRKRALDVISEIIDKKNISSLVPDVMKYIKFVDHDFHEDIVSKLFTAIIRFSPSIQWKVETLLKLIKENGMFIGNDIITAFCKFISKNKEICNMTIKKLEEEFDDNINNQPYIQIASYCIGEYEVNNDKFLDKFLNILLNPLLSSQTICYVLSSIAKLGSRFNQKEKVINGIQKFYNDARINIQQRAGEIIHLLSNSKACELLISNNDFENESTNINNNDEDDLLLIDLEPLNNKNIEKTQNKNEIPVPKGAVRVMETSDFVVFFEIKINENNQKQIAIRSSFYNKSKVELTNFHVNFGVPEGWKIHSQPPTSLTLNPYGGAPIQQVLFLENFGDFELSMRAHVSFMFHSQKITSVYDINKIIN